MITLAVYALALVGLATLGVSVIVLLLLTMAARGTGESAARIPRAARATTSHESRTPSATAYAKLSYACDRMQEWADARAERITRQRIRCAAGVVAARARLKVAQ